MQNTILGLYLKSNCVIKLSLTSFLIFLIGCLIGYFGYEYVPSRETIGASMFLALPTEPTALDYMTNNIGVAVTVMLGGQAPPTQIHLRSRR